MGREGTVYESAVEIREAIAELRIELSEDLAEAVASYALLFGGPEVRMARQLFCQIVASQNEADAKNFGLNNDRVVQLARTCVSISLQFADEEKRIFATPDQVVATNVP
jgi:hypothetical protein